MPLSNPVRPKLNHVQAQPSQPSDYVEVHLPYLEVHGTYEPSRTVLILVFISPLKCPNMAISTVVNTIRIG